MSDIEVDIRTDENVHGVTDPSAAGTATQTHIMSSASEGGGGTGSLRGVTSEVPGGSTCGSIGGSANPSRRNSRRTGWGAVKVPTKMGRKVVGLIMRAPPSKKIAEGVMTNTSSMGEASVYHALVVIFLEFFAWGLLTSPMITVLNESFPEHTFLMNGIIVGIKGFLSFLSAPLVGALSDHWGRKPFLLITVAFTCAPIPLMKLNSWWYFATISLSGAFAVTFSVVFAYVADVTEEADRSAAYGLVSATFAASLVTSPALGAYLEQMYDESVVVAVATIVAILDVLFIIFMVPESLPDKCKPSKSLTLDQVDPFSAMKKIWKDKTILMICLTVFLSYLPEAGQYSCFFVYLRLVMHFSKEAVAMFIAAIGILSVIAQTGLLTCLMKTLGSKHTIMVGLLFEMLQLMWYGFGSQYWMMWAAGILAAVSSITYPAISAFVSMHAEADKQGLVQGIITGMRGLCNGLGPAMFGLVFSLFHVDLSEKSADNNSSFENNDGTNNTVMQEVPQSFLMVAQIVPGPPFVFGALLVILALIVAAFIPENMGNDRSSNQGSRAFDHHSDHSTASKKFNHEITKKSDDDFDDYDCDESDGEFRIPLMDSAKGGVL